MTARVLINTVCLIPLCYGATLRVGPNLLFATPCLAFAAAAPGDTVEIDSRGAYAGAGTVCGITTPLLTVRGVGPKRALIQSGGRIGADNAIWLVRSPVQRIVFENLEFAYAQAAEATSAIRFESGVSFQITDCHFHENTFAILTTDSPASDALIEHSIFEYNGTDGGAGVSIGNFRRLTLQGNYLARAFIRSHLFSSRAAESYILYNRFSEENFFGALEAAFPTGGRVFFIGNLVQQEDTSSDKTLLSYQSDAPIHPVQEIYIINNTFVSLAKTAARFIHLGPAVTTPVFIRNNIFHGLGTIVTRENSTTLPTSVILANNFEGDPNFVNLTMHDYRLKPGAPAIDAGQNPGSAAGYSLTPDRHYAHPACLSGRAIVSKIDIGAYEFEGDLGASNGLARCIVVAPPRGDPVTVTNGASFTGPLAPGSIATIFGTGFADLTLSATAAPLPRTLNGVSVTVNGLTAPIFFVSPTQINVQIPFDLDLGEGNLLVTAGPLIRPSAKVRISSAAPGIFLHSTNRAVAQNQDSQLNIPQSPAAPGSIITVYMTGQGRLTSYVPTGSAALIFPLSEAALPSSATLGGKPVEIAFLGLTPGLVGVLQANLRIPLELPPGDHTLLVTIDGVTSNPAQIAVGQS